MKRPRFLALLAGTLLAVGRFPDACAAPIPKLYNTGVCDTGAPLPDATVDPHYTLIESPDPEYPGPQTFTLEAGWPVAPAGPWVADSAAPGGAAMWTEVNVLPTPSGDRGMVTIAPAGAQQFFSGSKSSGIPRPLPAGGDPSAGRFVSRGGPVAR